MSLKAVHILFISLSILLAFGFAAWEIKGYTVSGDVLQLLLGLFSLVAAVGLIVYGVKFLRKLKHVSFI